MMISEKEKLGAIKHKLKTKGVWGVGLGLKEVGGKVTKQHVWRIYVDKKITKDKVHIASLIPLAIEGIPTDVIEKVRTSHCTNKYTSIPGRKIANSKGVPGTLGCVAITNDEQTQVCLTNYHVLFGQGAGEGDKIFLVDHIHGHYNFNDLGKTLLGKIGSVKYKEDTYYIDCAIGRLLPDNASLSFLSFPFFNKNLRSSTSNALVGSKVRKAGSATHITEGIIIDVNYPDVSYFEGIAMDAPNQILIKPVAEGNKQIFSAAGDSGSVIINEEDKIVGLLWGTNSKGEGIACHIFPILRELDISILSPPSSTSHTLFKGEHFYKSIMNVLKNLCGS